MIRKQDSQVIKAIVMIQVNADSIPETAQAIADVDGVTEVYSCAGDVDLIAIAQVTEHEQLASLIPGRISKIPGVVATDTHIAFRSYSRQDTEAAFAIGSESSD
ncbi:DNA-binding Lrp family transcriptional regulator [Kibdelosporangium banguiense]|uniref:DNA-binding Lrp family transcriptional regulator n=1 Tax=Kibdelosporangium banguiense TaxID=1365924 RepID=A0ABS4U3A0_9PSEU|nr:DNA-binding Lrp family transcriptional regulator [Kibdelosporangium banguiense]